MAKKTATLIIISLIGLALFMASGATDAEEKISGIVISVHLSPGTFKTSLAIVNFLGGQTKIFAYNTFIHEIRINELNVLYYEDNRITRIEHHDMR